jgi:hypothetical protein
MKLIKQASGKTTVKMSRSEWTAMGKKAGWMKEAILPTSSYDVGDIVRYRSTIGVGTPVGKIMEVLRDNGGERHYKINSPTSLLEQELVKESLVLSIVDDPDLIRHFNNRGIQYSDPEKLVAYMRGDLEEEEMNNQYMELKLRGLFKNIQAELPDTHPHKHN